jgi:DNA-directed RNA polymerase specialized sigma24 family protein
VNPLTNVPVPPGTATAADPAEQVTALYQAHALGLLRLAVIMLEERQTAEDVVQDAFLGLFRRWGALNDPERALAYVRSSVFNGCRTVLRKRARNRQFGVG